MTGVAGNGHTGAAGALDDAVRAFVDDLAPEVETLGAAVESLDTQRCGPTSRSRPTT